MSRSTLIVGTLLTAVGTAQSFPVNVTNCGVTKHYSGAPTRAVTMNQGATEFLLALGLEGSMVGTAYLDDAIWPKYATAYNTIPVLSSGYPNETHIMAQSPDFIVASYNSAFRANYTQASGRKRGVFSPATVGPCEGNGSDWGKEWTTCRPQLHAAGVGTYIFEDYCEDESMRPTTVTEETVYSEMRALGSIFGVDAESMITEMKDDFDSAAALVSSSFSGAKLKTAWIDCVGSCCKVPEGQEKQVFVGSGFGAPNMLMKEAGLDNIFADTPGNWACVNVSDIVAAAPDVLVVVDAAWDTAISKIKYLYNDPEFCQLEVLRAARFVSIPFSATTLSPRNGPAALDLAVAALHVRTGSQTATQQSGVASFSPYFLQFQTGCTLCPLRKEFVVYDDESDKATQYDICTTTSTTIMTSAPSTDVSKTARACLGLWPWAFVGSLTALRASWIWA